MAKSIIPLNELPVIDKGSVETSDLDVYSSGAIIVMDKPLGWSSFDIVKYVRIRVPAKKVGHAGTLDPLATGLLLLCSGKATRTISEIQSLKKNYVARIKFGASTPSYDSETEPNETAEWQHITEDDIRKVVKEKFTGTIFQTPPAYSAIKVKGERLYKKARKGEDVELPVRQISIDSIEIQDFSLPEITVKVHCGKGTYIRSLAHDLGIALDSRAHLTWLRRTDSGGFSVENALTPDQFGDQIKMIKNG